MKKIQRADLSENRFWAGPQKVTAESESELEFKLQRAAVSKNARSISSRGPLVTQKGVKPFHKWQFCQLTLP